MIQPRSIPITVVPRMLLNLPSFRCNFCLPELGGPHDFGTIEVYCIAPSPTPFVIITSTAAGQPHHIIKI